MANKNIVIVCINLIGDVADSRPTTYNLMLIYRWKSNNVSSLADLLFKEASQPFAN